MKGTAETIDNISWYPGMLYTVYYIPYIITSLLLPWTDNQNKNHFQAMDLLNELKSTYDKLRVLRVDRTSSGPLKIKIMMHVELVLFIWCCTIGVP